MYTRIAGPETLRLSNGEPVRSREDVVSWTHARLQERGNVAELGRVDIKVSAKVDDGRWIVPCPCSNVCLTRPDWRFAACDECGALLDQIVFPEDAAEIERILLKRPQRRNQNWRGESVEELRAENLKHGVEI